MKKLLIVSFCLFIITGCGSSGKNADNHPQENNGTPVIEIALKEDKWTMLFPNNWEKQSPFPEKGIIFLAISGSQNIVITHEEGFTKNISDRLLKTLKNSLSMVTEISKEENTLIFRGKLSATTPMREFYQKTSQIPNTDNFLLFSCSQEVSNLGTLDCPSIMSSFIKIESSAK